MIVPLDCGPFGRATLAYLRGGLIVSVQADADSALNSPATIAVLATVAVRNGAKAVRIEGVERIAAVRAAVDVPIVGLIKKRYEGFEPYITPTSADIFEVVEAGADIVAFDATDRPRPDGSTVAGAVSSIRVTNRLAMADCARASDAAAALAAGADIAATTLCGYTDQTLGARLPALGLVRELIALGGFVVCEGGVADPAAARSAFAAGANAICVGTAITNVDALVRAFVGATPRGTAC
jgi:N-acylglucosamine-6-phosphate 2-epimerase